MYRYNDCCVLYVISLPHFRQGSYSYAIDVYLRVFSVLFVFVVFISRSVSV